MNMYRCEICCNVSPSGQHMLRHTIYRKVEPRDVKNRIKDNYGNFRTVIRTEPERYEIAKEVALCKTCYEQVQSGVSLNTVVSNRGTDYRGYSPSNNSETPKRIPINHAIVEEQSPRVNRVGTSPNKPRGKDFPNSSPNKESKLG